MDPFIREEGSIGRPRENLREAKEFCKVNALVGSQEVGPLEEDEGKEWGYDLAGHRRLEAWQAWWGIIRLVSLIDNGEKGRKL